MRRASCLIFFNTDHDDDDTDYFSSSLLQIWYIGAVIASLYFFVQAIADSTWLDILLLVLPLGALAALCLFMVSHFAV